MSHPSICSERQASDSIPESNWRKAFTIFSKVIISAWSNTARILAVTSCLNRFTQIANIFLTALSPFSVSYLSHAGSTKYFSALAWGVPFPWLLYSESSFCNGRVYFYQIPRQTLKEALIQGIQKTSKEISRLTDFCGYTSCPVLQEPENSQSLFLSLPRWSPAPWSVVVQVLATEIRLFKFSTVTVALQINPTYIVFLLIWTEPTFCASVISLLNFQGSSRFQLVAIIFLMKLSLVDP